MKQDIPANEIARLLMQTRHADDVCVPECKTGPSQGVRHRVIDLWTVNKSWARMSMKAYEIKVSKADYNQDDKWHDYLPYCHQFYFACPWGLIQPSEVPGECGLVWCSKNLRKVYEKKKAARRILDPEKLSNLVLYILFSRTGTFHREMPSYSGAEKWRAWLDGRANDSMLGYSCSKRMRELVAAKITAVEHRNEALERENENLRELRKFAVEDLGMKEADLSSSFGWAMRQAQDRLRIVMGAKDTQEVRDIKILKKYINESMKRFNDNVDGLLSKMGALDEE